jgi:hypothetical protein
MFDKPLDFWVKWIASIVALLHVWLTAHDVMPYYKFTGLLAAALWTLLGVLWRQPSIWILNSIFIVMYIKGIINL